MSIPQDAITQKLSIGKDVDPKDALGQKGSLSIGDEQYNVRQDSTHQINNPLLSDSEESIIGVRTVADNNNNNNDIGNKRAPEQTGKIRFSSLNFDTPKISKGWRILTTPLAFLKSVVVGAAVGAGAGAGVGAATGPGAAATAILGGAGGAAAGAGWGLGAAGREARTGELADQLVAGKGWKSQNDHGNWAITTLNRGGFFKDEQIRTEAKKNFAQVSDREWRKLLHVPTHYRTTSWFHAIKGKFTSTEPRIKDARDRQKIREALMLYVARNGKAGAAAYRAQLLETGSQNPARLQTEINRFKAGMLVKQVAAATSPMRLNEIIQQNPEVFAHPQEDLGLSTENDYKALAVFRGSQAIFGVVDRLDTQGGVTQADREDLINAFKTAGVDNPPDILRNHVGKPMTSALRHKIVEAFRDHIIQGQRLFDVGDYKGDMLAAQRVVDKIAGKGYKDATTETERETRSKQEMQVIRDEVNGMYRYQSTKNHIESHLRALAGHKAPNRLDQGDLQNLVQQAQEQRRPQQQRQQPTRQPETGNQQFQNDGLSGGKLESHISDEIKKDIPDNVSEDGGTSSEKDDNALQSPKQKLHERTRSMDLPKTDRLGTKETITIRSHTPPPDPHVRTQTTLVRHELGTFDEDSDDNELLDEANLSEKGKKKLSEELANEIPKDELASNVNRNDDDWKDDIKVTDEEQDRLQALPVKQLNLDNLPSSSDSHISSPGSPGHTLSFADGIGDGGLPPSEPVLSRKPSEVLKLKHVNITLDANDKSDMDLLNGMKTLGPQAWPETPLGKTPLISAKAFDDAGAQLRDDLKILGSLTNSVLGAYDLAVTKENKLGKKGIKADDTDKREGLTIPAGIWKQTEVVRDDVKYVKAELLSMRDTLDNPDQIDSLKNNAFDSDTNFKKKNEFKKTIDEATAQLDTITQRCDVLLQRVMKAGLKQSNLLGSNNNNNDK